MDEHVRIGAAANALGVSVDTLRRWERAGRIAFERRGQERWLSAAQLAGLVREQTAKSPSGRNRLTGIVLDIRCDDSIARIEIACGPHRIVSIMSRARADELALRAGDTATAVMKPSAVVVERG